MTNSKVINKTEQQFKRVLTYDKYTDPNVLHIEMDKIFSKSWQLVGHTSQVKENGQFFTTEVANEPLIIIKGNDGVVRAFYNVCPHRATILEPSEQGKKKILQCMYHGWTFKTDGELNRAPNFRGVDNSCLSDACLKSVRLEIAESLIFVNLDEDATPLRETYPGLFERLSQFDFLKDLQQTHRKTRIIKSNWKGFIDNYLECDHCHIAHPGLVKTLDMETYQILLHDNYSEQCSTIKEDTQYGNVDLNEADMQDGAFYWLWPNVMITIYPGTANMATIEMIPIDHETTLGVYTYYFIKDDIENLDQDAKDLIAFAEQVRNEDVELVELQQRGFNSRAFSHGRFSPSEQAIVQFHEMVLQALEN